MFKNPSKHVVLAVAPMAALVVSLQAHPEGEKAHATKFGGSLTADIKTFFDPDTATFTHVVADPSTAKALVIDSVLNYDPYAGRTCTRSVDEVIGYITQRNLTLEWILETHIHADHLTAAHYLKQHLGGRIGIGRTITDVLDFWVPIFVSSNGKDQEIPLDASQFDHLFEDGEKIRVGSLTLEVLFTPGHTPACYSYKIGNNVFVGDTLLMPDLGTARTDFPGGDPGVLYDSIKKILHLPDDTTLYLCHDYPPENRSLSWITTIRDQKENNSLLREGVSRDAYIKARKQRDQGKPVPKLLLPSLQTNLRAGALAQPEPNGISYIKIPLNTIG